MDAGPFVDPEFRPASGPVFSLRDPGTVEPEACMRLVANPFLAAAAWIAWIPVTRWLILWLGRPDHVAPERARLLAVVLLGVILLIPAGFLAPFWLLQYHCLDCGQTGRISRWRSHLCPAIFDRRSANRPRRFRGPTPPSQVVLWLWFVLMAGMAISSFRR